MVSLNQLRQSVLKKVPDVEENSQTVNKENKDGEKVVQTYRQSSCFVQLAGVIGAFAVALGAYGAHVLLPRPDVSDERKQIFNTGNFYHFVHALALLGVPLTNKPALVGTLLLLGIFLFSGACYITAVTGNVQVAAAAPYGGIAFILGWTCMIL